MNPLAIRVGVFKRVIKAIGIPVKPLFTLLDQFFNDQVQGFFSKNVITLKIHIFLFQLKAFQLKEKSTLISSHSPSRAVPSAFIFVMVFVVYAHAAHAGFCFCVG